ncbi:hypothetical protein [Caballeronia sp. AZ1_KS37]|uniref:hypothetical protein n=1 Tax=Caballeronia sp. AZ1_KS37 TaxID=2921756 RepID=UPI0020287E9E|nr:hypothetical protein [Caballeronia sp. AZ1_KS37]
MKKTSISTITALLFAAGTAHALEAKQPPRNPFLAAEKYSITHFDSSQSDAFPYAVKPGFFNVDISKAPRVVAGPVNIMTLASTSPNYMWGVSSEGVTYIDVSNGGFKEVARAPSPGNKVIPAALHDKVLGERYTNIKQAEDAVFKTYGLDWTRVVNGVYSVVDKDNHVYYNDSDGNISMFGLVDEKNPAAGIKVIKTVDMKPIVGKAHLVGTGVTYDGKFVVASNVSISVFDRSLEGQPQTIRFAPGEFVSNSFAIDQKGGIYIASNRVMHKVVWTGTKLSEDEADGAWKAEYEHGDQPPAVKFGDGTGSTPTLMGFGDDQDKLVVITDGANRMHLVAFWRDQMPAGWKQIPGTKSPRIAGQIGITAGLKHPPKFVQSEQSVVVNGYGAFVVNNVAEKGHPDKLVDVLSLGPVNKPASGAERLEWDPKKHAWRSVWTRDDVVSISMVPSTSSASNMVFVNGYYPKTGWEITGMDWNTGKTVHRVSFGQSNLGNGAYAIIQYLSNGDLLMNSIGGPTRVVLKDAAAK